MSKKRAESAAPKAKAAGVVPTLAKQYNLAVERYGSEAAGPYDGTRSYQDNLIIMNQPAQAKDRIQHITDINELKRLREIAHWKDRHEIVRFIDEHLKSLTA